MVFFITVLRALAAILITNSHYNGVYPIELIANGGLLGDILFFSVSGYCLYNVKLPFHKWYLKRISRIYVPVLVITLLFTILKIQEYSYASNNIIHFFLYPTNFHFVASILLLYIPFYFISKIKWLRERIPLVMLLIAVSALCVYIFAINKSYYNVDDVHSPFIRFLFMESMLLGAYFKQKEKHLKGNFKLRYVFLFFIFFAVYFISKIVFSKYGTQYPFLNQIQILNQVIILALLFVLFRLFIGLDNKLEKSPKVLKLSITFIADRTLEIYLVQLVIIGFLRPKFSFPLNWIVLTLSILAAASALHLVCGWIYKLIDFISNKLLKAKKSI